MKLNVKCKYGQEVYDAIVHDFNDAFLAMAVNLEDMDIHETAGELRHLNDIFYSLVGCIQADVIRFDNELSAPVDAPESEV